VPSFLVICDGGNVRSHALAYVLHDLRGHEAIAVGRLRVTMQTMETLSDWADRIVLMQPHMIESIPSRYHYKVRCVDVGPDRWGIYVHPELLAMVQQGADWLIDEWTRATTAEPTEVKPTPPPIVELAGSVEYLLQVAEMLNGGALPRDEGIMRARAALKAWRGQ